MATREKTDQCLCFVHFVIGNFLVLTLNIIVVLDWVRKEIVELNIGMRMMIRECQIKMLYN